MRESERTQPVVIIEQEMVIHRFGKDGSADEQSHLTVEAGIHLKRIEEGAVAGRK